MNTIEEAVDYFIRHYNRRAEEDDGEEVEKTVEEKLTFRYRVALDMIQQMQMHKS